MKLGKWLKEKKISRAAFAAALDVHPNTINNIVNQRAGASLTLAIKIELATDGEVSRYEVPVSISTLETMLAERRLQKKSAKRKL